MHLAHATHWYGGRMSRSLIEDAFAHHVWATLRLVDTCLELDETDGYTRDVAMSIQLAGALQQGTDHRSQVCTALASLDVEPPHVDVINFGIQAGRVVEITPAS